MHLLRKVFLTPLAAALLTSALQGQTATGSFREADADIEQFLRAGRIVSSQVIGEGVTKSSRASLSFKGRVHQAQLQSINKRLNDLYDPDGKIVAWRDDYKHNVAAYKLDRLLMLEMVPPSIERVIAKSPTAVTWWADNVSMMESERERQKIQPPDMESWKKQLSVATTFDQLIYNIDRNTGNLLITKDWNLILIDHTRAFAPSKRLMDRQNFDRCSARLLTAIKKLNAQTLTTALAPYVTRPQIDAMLIRRDMIVKHFDKLIAEKGEAAVIFP